MRIPVVCNILSRLCTFIAAVLLAPLAVSIYYRDGVWLSFAAASAAGIVLGRLLKISERILGRGKEMPEGLRRREGFLVVTAGWVIMVLLGTVPFYLSGVLPSFADAFFESMSGFTTTGATVLTTIHDQPKGILFWRDFTHWIGGMGIIVLSVAILPELAVGGMQLFAAEATGIGTETLAPRIRETALKLWTVYVAMTALQTVLLLFGGLDLFDALIHSFGTTATGGFSNYDASIGHFGSLYVEVVVTVFMFLSALSFALHYRVAFGGELSALRQSTEAKAFLFFTLSATALVTVDLLWENAYDDLWTALRYASFQVVSIVTTTGYTTADFDTWPVFSRFVLVVLMFVGGCAGSTAGGVKVVRVLVVVKNARRELKRLIFPTMVRPITLGKKIVPEEALRGILGYFLLYFMLFVASGAIVSLHGTDLVTGMTAVASAMNSIGPGLGAVGATCNFAHFQPLAKLVLSFDMLIGRLEIYTVLILLTPFFWRRR